jgi:hypothetical protein
LQELELKQALQFCFGLGLAKVLSSPFPGPTLTYTSSLFCNKG